MLVPILSSRVKKPFDGTGGGVDTRKIRSPEGVAPLAREAKIRRVIAPAVRPGNDVLDVKSYERLGGLR